MLSPVMPTVRIVATGGTISNSPSGRIAIDLVVEDIESWHPAGSRLSDYARIQTVEVLRDGSEAFGPSEWIAIGKAVEQSLADSDVTGLVVTHGTMSMPHFGHLPARSMGGRQSIAHA